MERRFQPPLHVKEDPAQVRVLRHRFEQKGVWNAVKERPDVKIDHPVALPAALPACSQSVVGRTPRTIAVGVRVEQRLHFRLQVHADHRLGNSVRHGGHAERPCPSRLLRYLHRPDRRREIRPRRHPIPELVEVPFQVLLELCDRLPVDTSSPLIGPDFLVGLPDNPFGNLKRLRRRLRLAHRLIPYGWPDKQTWITRPLGSSPITGPSSLLRDGPPLLPATVLWPSQFLLLELLPLATGGPLAQ